MGGSGLKISAGLSGGAVNILMALVLFAVLGWGSRPDRQGVLMIEQVLTGAVAGGTCIVFAGLGEIVAERSGRHQPRHRGLDARAAPSPPTPSASRPATRGSACSPACSPAPPSSAVFAAMVLLRRANQIAMGLVVSFLGIGITALFGQDYVGQGVVPLDDLGRPRACRACRSSGRSCSSTTR